MRNIWSAYIEVHFDILHDTDMLFIILIYSQRVICWTAELDWHSGKLQSSSINNTFTVGDAVEEETMVSAYFKESRINNCLHAADSFLRP
jgi:hypothetical protein